MSSRRGAEGGQLGGLRRMSALEVVLGPTLSLEVGAHALMLSCSGNGAMARVHLTGRQAALLRGVCLVSEAWGNRRRRLIAPRPMQAVTGGTLRALGAV